MSNKIRLKGKNKILIFRDKNGIPIIEAKCEEDLYKGMGYCHAMDRGLQMLLTRILGMGRASEILDSSDEILEIDIFFRRAHFYTNADQEITLLTTEDKIKCDSYCEGVNEFFNKKIPWELKIFGYKFTPWKVEDSILISRIMGYVTLSQSQFDIERLLIEMIQAGIPTEKLNELFPNLLDGADFELIKKIKLSERIVPQGLIWESMIPRMMASNNWVISGNKTYSGKPILANDPHLETNRLPNVWCEIILKMYEKYSINATVPGLPAILIGRNANLSWGATYSFMDSIDSWIEYCKNGKYLKNKDEYTHFRKRVEIIKRKKKSDYEITFYENDHGVLDGNPEEEGYYLTTKWSGAKSGAKSLTNIFKMWNAKTVKEGMDYLGNIETSWNWVLADNSGNIGYQMSGLLPKRREGKSGIFPLPGWDPENNWKGFYSPHDLPRSYNPENDYFITANHNLNSYGNANPINISMGSYRADRIEQMILENNKHTLDNSFQIQYDIYSIQAEKFMKIFRPLLPDTEQGKILQKWNCIYSVESEGAFLFENIYKNLLLKVFGENGFGNKVGNFLFRETGLFVDFYDNFDNILLSENSKWFGDKNRDELYKEIIANSLNIPIQKWGDSQKLMLTNILFSGKLPKIFGFDKGPITLRGGRATPHQGQIYRSGGRATSFAPSYRFVTDLSQNTIHSNMCGGPSDRFFSKWYTSDLKNWINKKYKGISPN